MELAQAMSRLGVQVKVFGVGGGIAAIQDPAIRDYANTTFNGEFYLDASAQVKSVNETATGVDSQLPAPRWRLENRGVRLCAGSDRSGA